MTNIKMKTIQAFGAAAFLVSSMAVVAQDEPETPILRITEIGVKIGHGSKFREGILEYKKCHAENDGEGTWSAWKNVDGNPDVYHMVSTMPNWAAMDESDPADAECWKIIELNVAPHMSSVSTRFARRMADWSGNAEGFEVVRLHQFRVDDGSLFRETVGAMTSIMKEAEYPHLGTWYDVIGSDSNEPGYFVVSHYANFAAMDEDRAGAYATVSAQAGEERADELWAQFGESLHDDWEYSGQMLRRIADLSHTGD